MNEYKNNIPYEDTFYIVPRYIRILCGHNFAFLDVYETMFQFWNKGLTCFLSNPAISQRTGVSLRQVKEALTFFESKGELRREKKGLKRFLIKPERRIETEEGAPPPFCINDAQEGAPPPQGGRSTALQEGAPPPPEYKEVEYKEINTSSKFVISQFADEWILRIKRESGDKREDNDLLMQVKYRIDNRDQTKHTETQTLKSTVKWMSQGCFDVPAGYINPKDAERKKNQEAVKKREFDEAQARQHEEKMRSYKSSSESKPSQERRASPTRLADLLKGKIPDAN